MTSQPEHPTADRLRVLADLLDASDRIAEPDARHDARHYLLVKLAAEVDRLAAECWRGFVRDRAER
jgi:hypothetical protein